MGGRWILGGFAGARRSRRFAVAASVLVAATLGASAAPALADMSASISTSETAPTVNTQQVTFTANEAGSPPWPGCTESPGGPAYDFHFNVDGSSVSPTSENGTTATYTTTFSTTGGHPVYAVVQDNLASQGCTTNNAQSSTITEDVVNPLSEGAPGANPSGTVNEGDTVAFTAPNPTGGEPPFTYDWSFSSASGPFTDAQGQQISRRLLSSGSVPTYVRVTDSASPAHTTVASVTTQVNPAAPQGGDIVQSPGGQVDVGAPVTFTAVPNGGVSPYTYNWSFTCKEAAGQLHDATGQTVTRTFTSPGVYNTCVQITDSAQPPTLASYGVPYIVAIQTTVVNPTFTGSSSCTTGQTTSVAFQLTHVTGCLDKQSDGSYKATSQIRVNGVPITPASGYPIVITPPNSSHPGGQIGVDLGQVALGGVVLYEGPISVDLPAGGAGDEKAFFTKTVKPVSLFGLKLGGTFTVNLGQDSGGHYYSTFTLTIDLPSVFKNSTGTGGITGTGSIKVDDDGTVEYNGATVDASDAEIGPVGVKDLCFSLIPGDTSDVTSCPIPSLPNSFTGDSPYISCSSNPASGDHWDATAVIDLPTPSKVEMSVFGGGVGASLTDLGGYGTNLKIPIAEDVFLNTIGAGFCFTSPLTIRGDVGVGMFPVPDKGDTVDINGMLTFTDASPWSLALDGTIDVFGDQVGSGGVTVYGDGSFDFNASLGITFANFLSLNGGVDGWVEPSNQLFDIEGNVQVCLKIVGNPCLGANGVVSSTGAAGCINIAGISAGAGYTWATKQLNVMGLSCSVAGYQATKASIAAAGGARLLHVARGTRGVALRLAGANGPPKVNITGPGGTDITSPAGGLARGADYLLIEDPANGTTNVLLAHPKHGTYKITSSDPSNPITSLETAPVLAPFSGHGKVAATRGGKRHLRLRYVLPQGATLSLVEHGKHVERGLARNVHGGACGGKHRHIAGGQLLCFTTTFTPARGPGGDRKIEAVVQRGGIPMTIATVAHYRAPAQRRPSKPSKVQLVRHGTKVTILWTASAGAARYAVSARTSDGRSLSYTPALRCRAVTVTHVPKNVKVTAIVEGVRYDTVRGRPATATLKTHKRAGGATGKLRGPECGA